ncbi:MAG: hypothetical protein KAY37_05635 [Phycisphaerae bacterium]|nr:hypothetical protein [Phycisphaerae bacterium]
MNNDLYFVPIIAQAMQETHPEHALRQAFVDITALGRQPAYARGFQQFQEFMAVSVDYFRTVDALATRVRMAELVAETADTVQLDQDPALDQFRRDPRWRAEYERVIAEIAKFGGKRRVELTLMDSAGVAVGSIRLAGSAGSGAISRIAAGTYSLTLDTGWVLWEDTLTEGDLVWAAAFPGRPLKLAADTGEATEEPTKKIELLDGELTLCVFPGVETGRIAIEWRAPGGDEDDG